MVAGIIKQVVLARVKKVVGAVGLLGAAFVLGLPIIAVLFVLGMVLKGSGIPPGVQEAIGLVVGFGLLAVVMGAFGYYLIDW